MSSTAVSMQGESEETSRSCRAVLAQAVLSHAATLAREGRLSEAANVLSEMRGGADDVRVLDLLAKIRAQQGDYAGAEELWARAKAVSGGDQHDAALKRVRALRTRPAWVRAAPVVAGFALAAGLAAMLMHAAWTARALAPAPRPAAAAAPAVSAVAQTERVQQSPPEESRASPATFPGGLPVAGVRQTVRGAEVELSFEEGLFLSGVSLRPGAVALIGNLGERLGTVPAGSVVIITGHTDDLPVPSGKMFADNAALGLARANVVMRHLAAASARPVTSFLLGTAADEAAPYPNDGRENRARNRTVTIRVRHDARVQ